MPPLQVNPQPFAAPFERMGPHEGVQETRCESDQPIRLRALQAGVDP